MKQITVYNWRLKAQTHGGAVYRTRHKLTEDEAKARDPEAVACEGTGEVRTVYEPGDEMPPSHTSPPRRRE